jgi:hypothetical protein
VPFVLFPGVAIFGIYQMTIRCPKCRRPIAYWGYGFWVRPPKLCRKCGYDLTIDDHAATTHASEP